MKKLHKDGNFCITITCMTRDGEIVEKEVNRRLYELAKTEGKERLCATAKARQLRVRVYSFLPVRLRDEKNFQCGGNVRRAVGYFECSECKQYREALFAFWENLKLQKHERYIPTAQEWNDGDFMSLEDLNKATDPTDTAMARAFLEEGVKASRTKGAHGEPCYRDKSGKIIARKS